MKTGKELKNERKKEEIGQKILKGCANKKKKEKKNNGENDSK